MKNILRHKTHFFHCLTSIVLLLCMIVPGRATAANVSLTLHPSSSSVQQGSNVTVEVRLTLGSAKTLDAIGTINYPADKLQYLSVSGPGSQGPEVVATSGSYKFDLISNSSALTGTVSVVNLTFKALVSSGSANLSISSASVGDDDSPPPAQHQVTASGTTISFTAPPNTPSNEGSGSNNSNAGSNNQSNPKPSNPGQATAQEVQANSDLNDDEAVPVTGYKDATGYLVDIKVLDKNNQPIAGSEVRIGDQTVTTNENGIASFTNITAGEHVVSTAGTDMKISVSTGEPSEAQSFVLERKERGIKGWLVYIPLGLITLLLVALCGWFLNKKLRMRQGGVPAVTDSAAISKEDTTSDLMSKLGPPSVPKPDQVFAPTKKPNDP